MGRRACSGRQAGQAEARQARRRQVGHMSRPSPFLCGHGTRQPMQPPTRSPKHQRRHGQSLRRRCTDSPHRRPATLGTGLLGARTQWRAKGTAGCRCTSAWDWTHAELAILAAMCAPGAAFCGTHPARHRSSRMPVRSPRAHPLQLALFRTALRVQGRRRRGAPAHPCPARPVHPALKSTAGLPAKSRFGLSRPP